MILRIIVKILGGMWTVRQKHNTAQKSSLQQVYKFLFVNVLQSKGSWISMSAKFHSEPCFPHGVYGVFISGGAVLGKNCVIFQNVTIGSNALVDSKCVGAPTIGDNCYIGAGTKIIGNVNIGNNVRIGANSVVYRDVPSNNVVISNLQRNIQREQPLNNRFYHKYKGAWEYFEDGLWEKEMDSKTINLLDQKFSER